MAPELARLPCPGRQHVIAGLSRTSGDGPPAVGRKRDGPAVAKPNRGRAIGFSKIDRSLGAAADATLGEQQVRSIPRDVGRVRRVEPCQVSLLRVAGREDADAAPVVRSGDQQPAVRRDVVERGVAGNARDEARLAARGHGVHGVSKERQFVSGRKPDLSPFQASPKTLK